MASWYCDTIWTLHCNDYLSNNQWIHISDDKTHDYPVKFSCSRNDTMVPYVCFYTQDDTNISNVPFVYLIEIFLLRLDLNATFSYGNFSNFRYSFSKMVAVHLKILIIFNFQPNFKSKVELQFA